MEEEEEMISSASSPIHTFPPARIPLELSVVVTFIQWETPIDNDFRPHLHLPMHFPLLRYNSLKLKKNTLTLDMGELKEGNGTVT